MPPVVPRELSKLNGQSQEGDRNPWPVASRDEEHRRDQADRRREGDDKTVRSFAQRAAHTPPTSLDKGLYESEVNNGSSTACSARDTDFGCSPARAGFSGRR